MPSTITPALQRELEQSGNVSCVVDDALRLVYCNPAWDRFALGNGGDAAVASRVVGTDLMNVIPAPLQSLYERLFASAREDRQMWPLDYECSSADLHREFRMEIRPLPSSASFVIVHSLRVERPHSPDLTAFSPHKRYQDVQGVITMCAHCRKTRRVTEPETWDWVPDHVRSNALRTKISHGLCGPCNAYFYPRTYKGKAIGV